MTNTLRQKSEIFLSIIDPRKGKTCIMKALRHPRKELKKIPGMERPPMLLRSQIDIVKMGTLSRKIYRFKIPV